MSEVMHTGNEVVTMRFRDQTVMPVRLASGVYPFDVARQNMVVAHASTKAEVRAWADWWEALSEIWDDLGIEP